MTVKINFNMMLNDNLGVDIFGNYVAKLYSFGLHYIIDLLLKVIAEVHRVLL